MSSQWEHSDFEPFEIGPMTALTHYLSKLCSSLYAQSLMSLPYTGGEYQVINGYSRW